jgi:hypothetical protein
MKSFKEILSEMSNSIDIEGMTVTKKFFKNAKKKFGDDTEAFEKMLYNKLGMAKSQWEGKEMAATRNRALGAYKEV